MSGFPLDRYLSRIGLDAPPRVDPDGLASLQRHQMRAIPFENLDVLLGRPVRLEPEHLVAKLVDRPRGGYCYELNSLLELALRASGFDVRPLLARVLVRRPPRQPGPKTHQLLLVELEGRPWVADAGFGFGLPFRPMLLEEGTVHDQLDARLRLKKDAELGWVLQKAEDEGWNDLYCFDLERVWPVDLVVANHFSSAFPASPFVRSVMLSRALEGEARLSVVGDRGAVHRREGVRPEPVPTGADRIGWLRERFGIELDAPADALPPWPPLG